MWDFYWDIESTYDTGVDGSRTHRRLPRNRPLILKTRASTGTQPPPLRLYYSVLARFLVACGLIQLLLKYHQLFMISRYSSVSI